MADSKIPGATANIKPKQQLKMKSVPIPNDKALPATLSAEKSVLSFVEPVFVYRRFYIELQAFTQDNKPSSESIEFQAKLVHKKTKEIYFFQRKKVAKNKYVFEGRPLLRGKHELRIHLNDHVFKTLVVTVAPDPVYLQGPPARIIEIECPRKIAVNSKQHYIVTEEQNCQLSIFDKDMTKIKSIGTRGFGNGQFDGPCAIAVDSNDNIYVSDCNNRVQKFSPKGEFLLAVGGKGDGPLEFHHPFGIAYNKTNDLLYIAEQENYRVQVLTTDLDYHGAFGERGSGNGRFGAPCGVCCDDKGDVYVADYGNNLIQVFTSKGQFKFMFSSLGTVPGYLNSPTGITTSAGVVYVTEIIGSRVSMFTTSGEFIGSFGAHWRNKQRFKNPLDVLVDADQNIIVTAFYKNCLQIF